MTAFDQLGTEARDAAGADLDLRSTRELVELMNAEDATVPAAVAGASAGIAALIDAVVARLRRDGRLVYAGAGSSGRLAALDAAECGPTFSAGDVVLAVTAEQDADEDDAAAGGRAVEALGVSAADAVVGISASGRSPYVRGALEAARAGGALTGCVVCVEGSELAAIADHEVCVPVGAEVLAGSTRLKAGTAQKLVLNMLSTVSMVRLGKTYGNLLVGLDPANEKLRARARSIVAQATGASNGEVEHALAAAGGDAKVAVVSLLTGLDAAAARARLAEAGGGVRRALETT
jgi:N-acetylmuramic acid 6-phosphate etherase